MKKSPKFKWLTMLATVCLCLSITHLNAQVLEKGITSTGKEVDCSTINPSVDKTVSEHGKIVTHPRVTRNGKLITDDCGCPVSIDCTNCTDTVNCISITMSAPILSGDVTSAVLQIFRDAGYTTQVGSDITAIVDDGKITATAANLSCYTKYYLRLKLNNNSDCTFDWTDSTRDMTVDKPTSCTVVTVRSTAASLADLSHEHAYEGSTKKIDSVYDHEGNAYGVVQIGNQCWLKENMRCETSPLSKLHKAASSEMDYYTPLYYDNTSSAIPLTQRGYLYNWPATMDSTFNSTTMPIDKGFSDYRGICPQGWHIPTIEEWYMVGNITETAGNPSIPNAGKYTTSCYWSNNSTTSVPGNYSYANRNESGMSVLPTGDFGGSFTHESNTAAFWTANSENAYEAHTFDFATNRTSVNLSSQGKAAGFAVRCVRDTPAPVTISFNANGGSGTMTAMNVMTMKDTVLDANTFTHGGNFEFAGWSTDQCSSEIAYADGANITPTKSITLYVQWHTYCTGTPLNNELGTSRVDSVKDHEENWYKVVQIGNQCWLKENMRCSSGQNYGVFTSYNTTTNTTTATTFSTPSIFANDCGTCTGINQAVSIRNEKGDSNFIQKYGYLYTWEAAIDKHNHTTQQSTPIQGICPEGWHLPTYDEYVTMFDYVKTSLLGQTSAASPVWTKSDNENPNGVNTDIAVALVGGCDWMSSSVSGSAGDLYNPLRNISGFTALPAHDYNIKFWAVTTHAIFWTATNNATTAASWYLGYNNKGLFYNGPSEFSKNMVARSVRCVRD